MKNKFVLTDNVQRYLTALSQLEERSAPEASWMMAVGKAGLGKSRTGTWWSLKNDAAVVRIKAATTPHWILTDLVTTLGEQAPAHSAEKLFKQAIKHIAHNPRTIVLDEVENALNNIKVLETIRDISDLTEVPVILLGREWVWAKLQTKDQFRTRVIAIAEFKPVTLADTHKCVAELAEADIAEDAVAEIHRASEGHIRKVIIGIGKAERIGRRKGSEVVAADIRKAA